MVSTSIQTTRRKSSRLEGIKSKEDGEKEKTLQIVHDSIPTSTSNNKDNNVRNSRSRKWRAAVVSAAGDDVCKEVTGNIKRVRRNSLLI